MNAKQCVVFPERFVVYFLIKQEGKVFHGLLKSLSYKMSLIPFWSLEVALLLTIVKTYLLCSRSSSHIFCTDLHTCVFLCVYLTCLAVCFFFAKQVTNRKFERVKWKCPKLSNFSGTFLTFRNINVNQFDRSFLVSFLWGNFFLKFSYLKFRSNKAHLV